MVRLTLRLAVSLLLLLAVVPAQAAEPTWYAWLTFGPENKVRFLLRLEGESVTLERRDGDKSVGKPRRFASLEACKNVPVDGPDGKMSYLIKGIEDLRVVASVGKLLGIDVEVKGRVRYNQAARVQMARRL